MFENPVITAKNALKRSKTAFFDVQFRLPSAPKLHLFDLPFSPRFYGQSAFGWVVSATASKRKQRNSQ